MVTAANQNVISKIMIPICFRLFLIPEHILSFFFQIEILFACNVYGYKVYFTSSELTRFWILISYRIFVIKTNTKSITTQGKFTHLGTRIGPSATIFSLT